MKTSLKSRILLCFSLGLVLVFVAQIIFAALFGKMYYTHQKVKQVEKSFYMLKEKSEENPGSMKEVIDEIEKTEGIYTKIIDKPTQKISSRAAILRGKGNKQGGIIRLIASITYKEQPIYVMMVYHLDNISSSLNILSEMNMMITLIACVIGGGVLSFIVGGIVKPIKSCESIANQLSRLDFSDVVDETSSIKELSSLARSINSMSRQLEEAVTGLKENNAKLQGDITQQKRLDKMRREFMANVSHEMKTPLSLLRIYCENLKSDIEGIDKDYYYTTLIEETERLDEMVKSMLDLASIENGLSKMKMEPIDFSQLAEAISDKMELLLKPYDVKLQGEKALRIQGDRKYIEQAMKNYITNAICHTREGDLIEISWFRQEEKVIFKVMNQGTPIDEEDLPHLFESFYKSDKSRKRVEGSHAGQGLYIVQTIIRNHGGSYGVENTLEGVVFTFNLPLIT